MRTETASRNVCGGTARAAQSRRDVVHVSSESVVDKTAFKKILKFLALSLVTLSRRRSRDLSTTSERLGAAAASTTVHAGYYLSISHCLFCGVTAAVAPPRSSTEGKPPVVRSADLQ